MFVGNEGNTMNNQYYKCYCSCCGGSLIVKDVELSTFCAYCGQPTIITEKITDYNEPNYIIPFKVTIEEAEQSIRKLIKKNIFSPTIFRHFTIMDIKGIYMPYWLFDIKISDKMYLAETDLYIFNKKYYRDAECVFNNIPCGRINKINPQLFHELNPFDMTQLREFNFAYLSGFYSEISNDENKYLDDITLEMLTNLFEEEVKKSIDIAPKNLCVVKHDQQIQILDNSKKVLLPVWFLECKYKEQIYVLMVNGQSGKTVGIVPVDWKIFAFYTILAGLIFSIIIVLLWYLVRNWSFWLYLSSEYVFGFVFAMIFFGCIGGSVGIIKFIIKMKNVTSQSLYNYIRERQDR